MPEAAVPELETQSGPSLDNAMTAIVTFTLGLISQIAATETQWALDPCLREVRLQDKQDKAHRAVNRLINGVRMWSQKNQAAASEAVANWGRGSWDVGGGKSFSRYLMDRGYVNAVAWGGPVTHAVLDGYVSHMGSGWDAPRGSTPDTWFAHLGTGVYVTGPHGNRKLQGPRLKSAWRNWKEYQLSHAYSLSSGRPNWQNRLRQWCGEASGAGWKVWRVGDPIAQDSKIGQAYSVRDLADLRVQQAQEACAVIRLAQAGPLFNPGVTPQEQAPVEDLSGVGGFGAGGAGPNPIALGALGLGVAAWLISR